MNGKFHYKLIILRINKIILIKIIQNLSNDFLTLRPNKVLDIITV